MSGFDNLHDLTPAQRGLLIQQLKGMSAKPVSKTMSAIPSLARDGRPFPLSFGQEQLWILDRINPGTSGYNIAGGFRLNGRLDIAALDRALNEIINRHESLRTTIELYNEDPMQVVATSCSVKLTIQDFSKLSEDARAVAVAELVKKEANRSFDLAHGPLLRANLFRLGSEEHVLLLVMHHIISDDWSMGVFAQEMTSLYEAYSLGRHSSLPPLPIQFADYAFWQRQQAGLLTEQLSYWKQQLDGASSTLVLNGDHAQSQGNVSGSVEVFVLPQPILEQIKDLGRRNGVTLFMTLLAAFQIVIFHHSRAEDIIVGTPVATRNRPECAGLIGFLVNTLPLRVRLSPQLSVCELLSRVREATEGAYVHQDVPLTQIIDHVGMSRDASNHALFRLTFALQDVLRTAWCLRGLNVQPIDIASETSKFDLTLVMSETSKGLEGAMEYNSSVFERSTIRRMISQLHRVVAVMSSDDTAFIGEIDLLGDAEKHKLVNEWNRTEWPCLGKSVVDLFEEQATRTPDAPAVICGARQMTYAELKAKVEQFAAYLKRRGVGPEVRVGICLDRGTDMVVALLAILKAQGAYVPLDRTHPRARLQYIVENAKITFLVTESAMDSVLPEFTNRALIDADWRNELQECEQETPSPLGLRTAAYVMYTSGSTGQSKGVEVEHRSLANFLNAMRRTPGCSKADVLLAVTTLSFDIAGLEFYLPLTSGGTVVIATEEERTDVQEVLRLIDKHSVTIMQATPATWRLLLDAGWNGRQNLRALCGGEALPGPLANRISNLCGGLWNMYGPTETTIWSSMYRTDSEHSTDVQPEDVTASIPRAVQVLQRSSYTPIGRPIDNTQLYVADSTMNLIPIGATGELYIGGSGVARGYVNNPGLTAACFLPNPFADNAGERLYRTGDLARWRTDGNLEFLGRIDQQVKLRGFRIEPAEVEAALRELHGVAEAAVVLREDINEETQLVAYLVAGRPAPNPTRIREALRSKLPEYMVPSAIVFLDKIPLTASGKLDRRSLPAPADGLARVETEYIEPRNEKEQLLASIWKEVLKLHRVGIHDKFFDLGGDSILGIQATMRANKVGIKHTPKQLFQHQTICRLVSIVNAELSALCEQGRVVGDVPITPTQRFLLDQVTGNYCSICDVCLFEVLSPLPAQMLDRAFQQICRHHDGLRTRFNMMQEGRKQYIVEDVPTSILPVDCRSMTTLQRAAVVERVAEELTTSIGENDQPLLRAAYFEGGTEVEGQLLIVAHRLIIDHSSWRILMEDLESACQQLNEFRPVELPPKTSSVQRWAQELRAFAQSWIVRSEREYWLSDSRRNLSGLSVDKTSGRDDPGVVESISVVWTQQDTQVLRDELPSIHRAETRDVLLVLVALAVQMWSGESRFLVSLETPGRQGVLPEEDVDVSRTVGRFSSCFPMLIELERETSPEGLLTSVKEQIRRVPRRGMGYGMLLYLTEDPAGQRRLAEMPKPELSFRYVEEQVGESSARKLFRQSHADRSPWTGNAAVTNHPLHIDASIVHGSLKMNCIYSCKRHRPESIQRLGEYLREAARVLIAHGESGDAQNYVAPRNAVELEIARIWGDVLDRHPIGVTEHFFHDLGGNSLQALSASSELEALFGQQIDAAALFQSPTVELFALAVGQRALPQLRPPLIAMQRGDGGCPFFCVHGGLGSPFGFLELAHFMGKHQPFYAFQAKGLDGKETPLESIDEMASYYIKALQSVDDHGPYALAGHSLGATIAFEMAQQLRRSKYEVSMLAVLDAMPPVPLGIIEEKDGDETNLIVEIARIVERFTKRDLSFSRENLDKLTHEQQLAQFLGRLRAIKFVTPGVGTSYIRGLIQVLSANNRAAAIYAPKTYHAIPVKLFRASDPKEEDYAHRFRAFHHDSSYGWEGICPGQVEIIEVPGDHITMLTRPHVRALAEELKGRLKEANQGSVKIGRTA